MRVGEGGTIGKGPIKRSRMSVKDFPVLRINVSRCGVIKTAQCRQRERTAAVEAVLFESYST